MEDEALVEGVKALAKVRRTMNRRSFQKCVKWTNAIHALEEEFWGAPPAVKQMAFDAIHWGENM